MIIIPLSFKIQRNPTTLKKEYIDLETKAKSIKPSLPKDWQNIQTTSDYTKLPSYAIRPDDDLIVIDCDSEEATAMIDNILVPTHPDEADHYIAVSDRGQKHFYFQPTKYYRDSLIYRKSRLPIGKIDLLHGKALVFTPCALNTTKDVLSGSLTSLTDIPDNVVDSLTALLKDKALDSTESCDYAPLTSYLAPTIEQSLGLYGRSGDYRDILNMMSLITPSQFKHSTKPDYHPDRVPDGEGVAYIQAITSKIGRDPSISLELHTELLTLITQKLWSDPLPLGELRAHIDSITGQTYSRTGKKVFVYNPNATAQPLVSINGNPYMPVYRTLDDQYILAKPTGSVELIKGINNFKRAMCSKNYSLLVDSKTVNNPAFVMKATENLETATTSKLAYMPSGLYEEDGSLYYNTYTPTKFLGIIRGEYQQEREHTLGSTPTIDRVLSNITHDHTMENGSNIIREYIEQFIAHKLKTLDYSPVVFQMMGKRGIGKGMFAELLNMITDATVLLELSASNSQFNADTAGKMFLIEDEGIVTAQVINTLKKLSGNARTRIEAKGVDATMAKNIATYMSFTNKTTPLAETIDDRRFVTVSSFKAPKLIIENILPKIALELEEWCLRLRDTKLSNPALYVNANEWHDSIHKEAFLEKSENTEHSPSKVAHLVYTLHDHTGAEIKEMLSECFGEGFHYFVSRKTMLSVPLYSKNIPMRLSDRALLTHQITSTDLKGVELGEYLREDKNMKQYNKRTWMLRLQLSNSQIEPFTEETVEPIEGVD